MKTRKAVNLFLTSRRAHGISWHTERWYTGILNRFESEYPGLPARPEAIESFIADCTAGDERRHGYFRAIRALYRFLHRRYRVINPVELIDPPRRKRKERPTLQPYQLSKLLSYPHEADIKAALLFLVDTGARVGELNSLDHDRIIETEYGFVAEINGKTGPRLVPILYETYHALMTTELPFKYTPYRLRIKIARAFKKTGIKGSGITLRHSFGTLWEGDEITLQRIMGHSSLNTTRTYRHMRTKLLSQQHREYSPLRGILTKPQSML